MTKANVKLVCGAIMMVALVSVGVLSFSDGRYARAVFYMIMAIMWSYIMISGYEDLPEK